MQRLPDGYVDQTPALLAKLQAKAGLPVHPLGQRPTTFLKTGVSLYDANPITDAGQVMTRGDK